MIPIAENPVRTAFLKVKKDIQDLRMVQERALAGIASQMQSGDKLGQNQMQTLSLELRDKLDAQKRDIWQAIDAMEDRISEMQKLESLHDKSIIELRKTLAQVDKRLAKLMTRLEDFEALSVEVADVEKHFITKAEVDTRLQKGMDALADELKAAGEVTARLAEAHQAFALKEDINKMAKAHSELRKGFAERGAVDSVRSRIDSVEAKAGKRSDSLKTEMRKVQDDMAELYDMRKTYATKQQIEHLNKEIRMLTEALKATQKKPAAAVKTGRPPQRTTAAPKQAGTGRIGKAVTSVKRFFIDDEST